VAARPVERALKKIIADMGGHQVIIDRMASGETLAAIAKTILVPRPDGTIQAISRTFLYDHLVRMGFGDAYQTARGKQADALVDDAIEIADASPVDSAYAHTKARNQIAARHWMAARLNRKEWGDESNKGVTFNIGELHLSALQKLGTPQAGIPQAQLEGAKIELADIEMVEDPETVE